jgi:hypothetical protein
VTDARSRSAQLAARRTASDGESPTSRPAAGTEAPPAAERRPPRRRPPGKPLGLGQKIGLALGALAAALLVLVTAGSHLFDEPLRRALEARMNQQLHGYTVRLGHAHYGLLALHLTLRDLVVRQQANPEPPVAKLPRLRLQAEWRYLLTRRLVGDAFFDRPSIHVDLPQLRSEAQDRLSPKQRGWQQAIESIYPLKLNRFVVTDGAIVYVDEDPQRPLEISHWNLSATNVRNLETPDHIYPSPVHTEGDIFGTGHGVIDGNANFLSQPFPGVHALYRLEKVPLDRLQQFGARANLELHRGLLSSHGEVEYAPRFKLVQVADVLFDGVQLDYVHTAATAAAERRRAEAVAAAAKRVDYLPVVIRFDQLHLTRGSVGYVDRAQNPNYRIFVDGADLDMENLSNRAAQRSGQPATAHLSGRFMGSGSARVVATFQPEAAGHDLGAEIAIENANLPALNDMLRAYEHLAVKAGTFSLYSQITVKNRYLRGYVKPIFHEVEVADVPKGSRQPFGAKLKQKVIGVLAHLLENHKTDQVATRADISGPLGAVRSNTGEILANLLRNAFYQAIRPGLESPGRRVGTGR